MPLGREVGLDPSNIVLDEDPASPPRKREQSPRFSAHIYCGQTAGWIKMPLGTEVGLGPGDVVLDGDPAPPKRGTAFNFRPMSIVAKRAEHLLNMNIGGRRSLKVGGQEWGLVGRAPVGPRASLPQLVV